MSDWLIDGSLAKKRMRGMGRYSFELINFLANDPINNVIVVVNNRESYVFLSDEFCTFKNVRLICIPIFFPFFEQIFFPFIRLRFFRSTYVSGGDSYSILSFFGKNIYLLHDIYFLKNDLFVDRIFHRILGRLYRRSIFYFAIFSARRIVTVSNFTNLELYEFFPRFRRIIARKVVVVENGTNFHNRRIPLNKREFDLVFISGLDPQKRFGWAIEQLENFDKKLRICVIGIEKGSDFPSKHQVYFQGILTAIEVETCLNNSRVLVVPSIDESFGVPVIEGLACGCKVVCSDSGALMSTGGHFPYRFAPNSQEAFLSNILLALTQTEVASVDFNEQFFDFGWSDIFVNSPFAGNSK